MAWKQYAFPVLCSITGLIAVTAGGFVLNGLLIGMVTSIALWMTIMKLPQWLRSLMGRWPLTTDLICLKVMSTILALIGSGPTIFMALVTQMVVTGWLLSTLDTKETKSWTKTSTSGNSLGAIIRKATTSFRATTAASTTKTAAA